MIRFNPFFGVRCLVPNVVATGGTVTEQDVNGVTYKVHRFNTSGTFTVLKDGENLEYFIVGGGGAGAGTDSAFRGGGGGGGAAITNNFGNGITISADTYTVTVGNGGTGGSFSTDGGSGQTSSFDTIASAAGGPGGFRLSGNTGLGGAAGAVNGATPGAGESGSGSSGGGGGGSVTAAGSNKSGLNGGNGADGFDASLLLGTTFGANGFFGGGGGGGGANGGTGGTGGLGGGTIGGTGAANFVQATRTTNTGGGGGGNGFTGIRRTGRGGDRGIVVIRYPKYINTCLPDLESFIMEVNTTIAGQTGSDTFRLPTSGSGFDFTVDWGDGVIESYTGSPGNIDHVYATGGIYEIKITGAFPYIRFIGTGDRTKLTKVKQWGTIQWGNWSEAFRSCSNLQIVAADAPNLSNVTSMAGAFQGCSNPNFATAHDFNVWDVSNITNMNFTFVASNFNRPIGNWNTGNVQIFQGMFEACSVFNQYIGDWNTGSANTMRTMFFGAAAFNQDISSWNTANVGDMQFMFASAVTFNQDLSPWCVSQFASEPTSFSGNTPAWVLPKPNWGAPC